MRHRLTREADADITRILKNTKKLFGKRQVPIYADIIERGIAMIAENPSRPSFTERDGIRPGVKSMHLELVKNRRKSASHLIYFKETQAPDGKPEVIIIGVVHENMVPKRKLGMVLRNLDKEEVVEANPAPGRR